MSHKVKTMCEILHHNLENVLLCLFFQYSHLKLDWPSGNQHVINCSKENIDGNFRARPSLTLRSSMMHPIQGPREQFGTLDLFGSPEKSVSCRRPDQSYSPHVSFLNGYDKAQVPSISISLQCECQPLIHLFIKVFIKVGYFCCSLTHSCIADRVPRLTV